MGIRQDDRFLHYILLDRVQAVTDGEWISLKGRHPLTITIEGNFVGTVKIFASNNPSPPANTFNDAPLVGGVALSTPAIVIVDAAHAWIKVAVTAWTSGTISAYVLSGQGPDAFS